MGKRRLVIICTPEQQSAAQDVCEIFDPGHGSQVLTSELAANGKGAVTGFIANWYMDDETADAIKPQLQDVGCQVYESDPLLEYKPAEMTSKNWVTVEAAVLDAGQGKPRNDERDTTKG